MEVVLQIAHFTREPVGFHTTEQTVREYNTGRVTLEANDLSEVDGGTMDFAEWVAFFLQDGWSISSPFKFSN